MYTVKEITPEATFAVRLPVLRPGKTVDNCVFDGDSLPTTLHFGIYDNETILGVISVFEANHLFFTEERQFQIRGMAVLDANQNKGLGKKLVQKAEEYIMAKHGSRIWFNAREIAVGFYQKMGYTIIGNAFNIGDIGSHYVMHKILAPHS